jgi:lipid II:glycine glycyltransferase (peptidoglycan interpeptide bridge formation enzyme)
VLRVTIEVFALEPEGLLRTSEALRRYGFRQVAATRTYERTLLLDLLPTEDALLMGFHKNARQGIRNVARFPVVVSSAESVTLAARLQELSDETRGRTGGEARPLDWDALIRMSAEAPDLSRIAILRRTDVAGPEGVLAFAWACMHGTIAEYSESGSTRADDLKVSTSYALLWDLMRWARANGARWFDMGGVTTGNVRSDDPLGGISDFKRRFTQLELEVGQQWELEPHPARAAAARMVSRSAALLRFAAAKVRERVR